jgi:hypothetical protein
MGTGQIPKEYFILFSGLKIQVFEKRNRDEF